MRAVDLPNGYRKIVLEWSERPDRDQAWYERERKSNPEFDREYLLTWGAAVGTPVFSPIYKKSLHEVSMEPLKATDVHIGIDFGFTRPAAVWAQFDGSRQLGIRHELLGEDEVISDFGRRIVDANRRLFAGCRFHYYGDPAGHQRNDRSERTSIQVLKDLFGMKVKTRPSEIIQGIDRIRFHLLPRADKRPGIVIDPVACPILAHGFARGYVRSETDPEKPFKDGYYDHLFDAFRYQAIHILKPPRRGRAAPRTQTPEEAEQTAIWRGLRDRGRPSKEHPVVGEW